RKAESAKNIPLLVTDFLDVLFMPFYEEYIRTPTQSAFIILFDGMRWDGWNAIKTRMLQTFWGKFALEKTVPLLSTLPTTTEFSRRALISGLFPNESITLPASGVIDQSDLSRQNREGVDNWWKLLSFAFAKRKIYEVQAITVHEQNLNQLVQLIEDAEVKVKVINFTLFDHKLHNSKQNLSTLYEEVLVNFDDIIQPCLERIPSDSLVFILSDHGLIEIKGKAQTILLANTEGNKRYFGLKNSWQYSDMFTSFSSLQGKLPRQSRDRPANIVFFDADDIKMPRSSGIVQYGFATLNTHLMTKGASAFREGDFENRGENCASWFPIVKPSSQPGRYAHGGISMQEMIVPCSIFVPKGKGQLELWQNGKTARGQDGKGLKGS
ncbi:PglZ domain-containing protein, partial [Candidatus Poribacteria bacterium]|nr:PglZ domain-containing protein [Candidatus Poribacteria bacterium]